MRGSTDNLEVVADADLVVLAVKPQDMAAAARGIARGLTDRRRLVVSVAAGIRLADLERWLGKGIPMVRAMPNRPALIGAGITALYAGDGTTADDRVTVERLMSAAGETVWLEQESQMDAATAISGSGPAYFFLLIEALEAAGTEIGLPHETVEAPRCRDCEGRGPHGSRKRTGAGDPARAGHVQGRHDGRGTGGAGGRRAARDGSSRRGRRRRCVR